jgi:hypothetical protein
MLDQECVTPRNQSFFINFNGIFDDKNGRIDEIWEKLKSKKSFNFS